MNDTIVREAYSWLDDNLLRIVTAVDYEYSLSERAQPGRLDPTIYGFTISGRFIREERNYGDYRRGREGLRVAELFLIRQSDEATHEIDGLTIVDLESGQMYQLAGIPELVSVVTAYAPRLREDGIQNVLAASYTEKIFFPFADMYPGNGGGIWQGGKFTPNPHDSYLVEKI